MPAPKNKVRSKTKTHQNNTTYYVNAILLIYCYQVQVHS